MGIVLNPKKVKKLVQVCVADTQSLLYLSLRCGDSFDKLIAMIGFTIHIPCHMFNSAIGSDNRMYMLHGCSVESVDKHKKTLVIYSTGITTHELSELRKTKIDILLNGKK
jgi:hypothetical protein